MVMKIHVVVFWVMRLYSDVVEYHWFGGPCCLHFHLEDGESKVVSTASQPQLESSSRGTTNPRSVSKGEVTILAAELSSKCLPL